MIENLELPKLSSKNLDANHLVIIDGYGFVFRAYHALPGLTCPNGVMVGAVFGFISMLFKVFEDIKATHMVVVFDAGAKNFRHQLYPAYKANRSATPEDLKSQFPLVREAAKAMNIATLEQVGYEADDIIATLAKQHASSKVTIVSSDKDLMQLVNDQVTMYDPIKSKFIGLKEVEEKFGVTGEKLLSLMALMGDASDNIPGVPGFGPKTALELIQQFGDLETLANNYNQIKQPRKRDLFLTHKELLAVSYKLVSLACDVKLEVTLDDLKKNSPNKDELIAFLNKYGFKRLYSRAEKFFNNQNTTITTATLTSAPSVLEKAKKTGMLVIHLHEKECFIASDENFLAKLMAEEIDLVKPLLLDEAIIKITHDAKKVMQYFASNMLYHHDLMLMSYLLNNGLNKHDLNSLYEKYFNISVNSLQLGRMFALYQVLKQELQQQKLINLYENFERPLSYVLYKMQNTGVKIDLLQLKVLSEEFAIKINELEKKIHAQVGYEFNIASVKQLSEALFKSLGLNATKVSKLGNMSTNAHTLEQLSEQGHEIADDILAWRHFSKLKSTYIDALPKQVNSHTAKIHSDFTMANTITGRLSSRDPNLQNIPIRSQEGTKIRASFIADEGESLISADYSQIELRLLAHVADIKVLKDAFINNQDIHTITAADVFGVEIKDVSSQMRRKAKAINFCIIYGISSFGLAKQLGISRSDSAKFIEDYFNKYPGIKAYMEKTKEFASNHGYISTVMGRKCYIPTINDANGALRSFAQRLAINAPLQGSAADIIKRAMILLDEALVNFQTKMILQVHDELLFQAPLKEVESVSKIIKVTMENALSLSVPLIVEVKNGASWAEIH
jgi:DNA polymerase-1